MPKRIATDDNWEDRDDDYDAEWEPEEEEENPDGNIDHLLGDDQTTTIECPHCRRQIYEESERCPHCEKYISLEDAPRRTPIWIAIATILCLFAVYRWVV